MALFSDPYMWLRPYYLRLAEHPAFSQFAPSHQFEQLVKAVEVDHPGKAESMRHWSPAAQHAAMQLLASMRSQNASTGEPVELWRVRKADRELRCIAVYLPIGIDVRVMEEDEFRRTQLCKDAPEVRVLAEEWKAKLIDKRWGCVPSVS